MTKNNAMRLGSVMLVLALLSTCALWGTFAKYTTESKSATQSARVAYWGFNAGADMTLNLFGESESNVTSSGAVDGVSNVVAPGTKNGQEISFAYTKYNTDKITAPEVGYNFTVDVTTTAQATDYAALDKNPNFHWVLMEKTAEETSVDKATDDDKIDTFADFQTAVKKLSGDQSGTKAYAAGNLPDFSSKTYVIGWVWDFETADDASSTDKDEEAIQDATDTAMGNATDLDNVNLTISVKAEQVD